MPSKNNIDLQVLIANVLFTVPVYEVISLHSIVKRNADGAHKVRLKAFGEHHDLQLEPSDRLFTGDKLRAWTAHHNATTDTVHYTELPNDVSPHRYFKKYYNINYFFHFIALPT